MATDCKNVDWREKEKMNKSELAEELGESLQKMETREKKRDKSELAEEMVTACKKWKDERKGEFVGREILIDSDTTTLKIYQNSKVHLIIF